MIQRRVVSDPRGWIAAYWLAFSFTTLICAIYYLSVPPSPDQSIYDEIGLMSMMGRPYYGGTFDLSWPGPFVYHELGVRIFGIHGWTARATDLALLPIGLAGLWLLAARAGFRTAAAALILLYPPIYVTSGWWMVGHRDVVGMHLLLLATGLLIGGEAGEKWRRFIAGALIAYATMIRPTYLFELLPLWLLEMRRAKTGVARLFATFELGAGAGGIFLLFVLAGLRAGTLHDWYEQAILFPVTVYQGHESRWRLAAVFLSTVREQWAWLALVAATGALLTVGASMRTSGPAKTLVLSVAGLAATVFVSYVVQNKGFIYHLGGLIPLMVFCAIVGIEAGWRTASRATGMPALLTYALFGVTVLGFVGGTAARARHYLAPAAALTLRGDGRGIARYVARRQDPIAAARVEAGAIIRTEARPGDQLLQWGWNFEAAFLSGVPSASRFTAVPQFIQIAAGDPNFSGWIDQFRQEMVPARVRFVLLDTTMPPAAPPHDKRVVGSPSAQIVRQLLATGYRVLYRGGDVLLLERA